MLELELLAVDSEAMDNEEHTPKLAVELDRVLARPTPACLAIAMLDRELAELQREDRDRRPSISWPTLRVS